MITQRVVFYVQRNIQRNKVEIYIAQKSIGQEIKLAFLKQMMFQEVEPGALPDADPMFVDWEDAQQLMDQLWNAGIRPSDGRDKNDIIEAKNRHIDTLQQVMNRLFNIIEHKIPNRS